MAHASAMLRQNRVQTRDDIRLGRKRLSDVMRNERPMIEGVEVFRLVGWLRGVGARKSAHIARGLPERAMIRDLTDEQFALLLMRITNYERRHDDHP